MALDIINGGDGIPAEPEWSALYNDERDSKSAAEHWGTTVRDMRTEGILTPANGPAIRRLTEFKIQYERAARHVAENGAILPASRAKIGQFNPYWAVMKHASEEIRMLEGELGIAPTKRGRATKVKRAEKVSRAADKYIKSVSA